MQNKKINSTSVEELVIEFHELQGLQHQLFLSKRDRSNHEKRMDKNYESIIELLSVLRRITLEWGDDNDYFHYTIGEENEIIAIGI